MAHIGSWRNISTFFPLSRRYFTLVTNAFSDPSLEWYVFRYKAERPSKEDRKLGRTKHIKQTITEFPPYKISGPIPADIAMTQNIYFVVKCFINGYEKFYKYLSWNNCPLNSIAVICMQQTFKERRILPSRNKYQQNKIFKNYSKINNKN